MYKFGQEIIAIFSGTTCPVWVAQYDRYIQEIKVFAAKRKKRCGKGLLSQTIPRLKNYKRSLNPWMMGSLG